MRKGSRMRPVLSAALLALAACSSADSTRSTDEPGAASETESPPPEGFERYRLSGPYAHANLAIYLLHRKDAPSGDLGCVTLEEALSSGAVRVSEKAEGAQVDELQIENTGERPVYLQAGDTVKGGQQDRTIAVDCLLPPRSGKRTIDAFCVEPGRWSTRGGGGALTGATFTLTEAPVATKEQKLAVRLEKRQEKVWEAGKQVNEELARKSSLAAGLSAEAKDSFVEAVEAQEVTRRVKEVATALGKLAMDHSDAVGAVFCVNGKTQNAEVYATIGLFRKLWPKLLRAASVEALAKQREGELPKPPAESDVRALLVEVTAHPGRVERRPGGPTVRIFERDGAVLFDTQSEGKLLHRQVLTK